MYTIGVAPDPKGNPVLIISAAPQGMPPENILNILRMIKQFFPALFDQVNLEIVKVNGGGLVLPDNIHDKPEAG